MTTHNLTCPGCGAALASDCKQPVCPACLMRQALASRTLAGEEPVDQPPPPPEEIAGRFPGFEILECLGRGGMGVVYKARQKSLDRLVAIKILPPERVGEEKFSERFAREAATLAKLGHPNIVTVHDFGETAGLFYIVMEYVDGVNLRDLLREGKLEARQALAIVPPICEALQYAHDKGIVHRDIKPENLLLDRDGRIKIADFGIASLVGASGESSGTPPYMAPEQSGGHTDHRADIYALGVVLYEMLTGERPAKEIVAPSRKVLLDVRIDEMVLRALEKEPERRYQTAGEFRTMVETVARPAAPAPDDSGREDAHAQNLERKIETFERRHRALLWYGFITSSFGLPAGLALNIPVVWGLSIAGILIGGYKLRVLDKLSAYHKTASVETMTGAASGAEELPGGKQGRADSSAALRTSLFAVLCCAVSISTIALGNAQAMMIGSGLMLVVGILWFAKGIRRQALLVALAAAGIAAAVVMFVNRNSGGTETRAVPVDPYWQIWQAGKPAEARSFFAEAVKLAPGDPHAWNGLGWACFNSGDAAEGEKAFRKAITLEPGHPGALNGLGQIHLSRRDYPQAEGLLLKAAGQNATAAWFGLARLYLLQGKFEDAAKWAGKITESGQADEIAKKMLEAAEKNELPDGLRRMIEPPPTAVRPGGTAFRPPP